MNPTPVLLRITLLVAASALVFSANGADKPSALDKEWTKIETPGPDLGSREIMGFILEAAGGPDHEKQSAHIDAALEKLEGMQDRDPAGKTYGNFRWYWREEKPGDRNAVEFVTQQAVLLRLRFEKNLSPAAKAGLDRVLHLSVEGIHRHKVDVGYTNIFLMKTWNLLALGEALNKPDLTKEGSAMLDQWIAFTSQNGIREFLSPTYYGVDLDSLALMATALSNPPVQEKATRILRLFWTDIAANWFEPGGRLGGAHGRDYDYLTGHGDLDRHLLDAGWIDAKQARPAAFQVFAAATRWLPPESLHKEALSALPRFVFQKWDAPAVAWASQYVGHHFSIGVSGAPQGPEDKVFALNLAGPGGPKTAMVNFFMDARNDPYGSNKVATGASGHPKAHHLFTLFNAVQRGPEVLFLASWPPPAAGGSKPESDPVCLLSHMDIPADAEAWTADHALDTKQLFQPLPGNLCFLRIGDVAVGIRFVLALDTAGKPAAAQLVNDGDAHGARRLTVTHSAGPPGAGGGVVAVFVRAEEGLDDAGFAAFRRHFIESKTSAAAEGGTIRVKAQGLKNALALEVDPAAGKLVRSEGADAAMQAAPMSVDGKEFSKHLLETNAEAGF